MRESDATQPVGHTDDDLRRLRDDAIRSNMNLEGLSEPMVSTIIAMNGIVISEANRILANRAERAAQQAEREAKEARRRRWWDWLDKF